jgi:uncharacterized protein (TIGR03437 family)
MEIPADNFAMESPLTVPIFSIGHRLRHAVRAGIIAGLLLLLAVPHAAAQGEILQVKHPCSGDRFRPESTCYLSRPDASASSPTYDQWLSLLAGGSPTALSVDSAGHIYVAGISPGGLPVTSNAFQSSFPANFQGVTGFLLKLDPTGSQILYGTYLPGLFPTQIVVDSAGYIYVLANHPEENVADYYPAPITQNAVQTYPGTTFTPTLAKLTPDGQLVYATFLGGRAAITGGEIAVDSQGSVVVCGSTSDADLPASAGAFQPWLQGLSNVFVAKISADGTAYEGFTYLGGEGVEHCAGLQWAPDGGVYVYGDTSSRFFPVTPGAFQTTRGAGWSLFLAKLNPALEQLLWSTYIGGNWDSYAQTYSNSPGTQSLALAGNGSLVFAGNTLAYDYPVSPGTGPPPVPPSGEAVFGVLDPTGSQLTFSWPIPGAGVTQLFGGGNTFYMTGSATVGTLVSIATFDAEGMAEFPVGTIFSFPILFRMDLNSQMLSYLGPLVETNGLNSDPAVGLAITPGGNLILGSVSLNQDTDSGYANFPAPVRSLGGVPMAGYNGVIFDLDFSSETQPLIDDIINPASLLISRLAPGQLFEVRGVGLGPTSMVTASDVVNLPTQLAGSQVAVNGTPVGLLWVAENAIEALAPAGAFSSPTATISVTANGAQSNLGTMPTAVVNPGLFTTSQTGFGQALATNPDGSANSPQHPIQKGQALQLLGTGLGAVNSGGATPVPNASITATVGGLTAPVGSVAPAMGQPAGYWEVDITVPSGVPEGDFILVAISASGTPSQPGVTISIR